MLETPVHAVNISPDSGSSTWKSAEQAYAIAARASAAPGGKDRGNQPIEVRQVISGPPEELLR
jgi:hypothetical protein